MNWNHPKARRHHPLEKVGRGWLDMCKAPLPNEPDECKPDPMPQTIFKCPKCGAHAYSLRKIYGISYLKCEHCGHKSGNL